jgi:hypothetical protein
MPISTCVILCLWHTGWEHSSKFLYTCPPWPLIGLWCEVSGTWNDWQLLYPSGDNESFVFSFRPYVGLHTLSWSSSLRGATFQIHLTISSAAAVPSYFSLSCNIHSSKSYYLKWKLHCLATSSLHAEKLDPNPGQTVSQIRPTRGICSEDTAPQQYVVCVILPYSTFCIYYQLVTHDVPLMIAWVECLILGCYY